MYLQMMPTERMGQDGKALLRSLQNESISLVDLLIRESFQNSLDATLADADETLIDVDVKHFDTQRVANVLPGIERGLSERFGDQEQTAIVIGDRNTSGLEGSIRDDAGANLRDSNLYKLVYGIAMNQDKAGAGGSWGLGKTSYFRVGAGIVFYYTRVKLDGGHFGERLVASLIENPENKDRLLKESDRGIAWWGTKDSENQYDHTEPTYPVTDEDEIRGILSIFGLNPYQGNETGTRIIIPFVNEQKLLPYKDQENAPVWQKDLSTALDFSIQRWYAPRIENHEYQQRFGSFARVNLNGEEIDSNRFNVIFNTFTSLYKVALTGSAFGEIQVKDVDLRGVTKEGPVGRVAFRVFSLADLQLRGMVYKTPEIYLSMNVSDTEDEFTYTNRKFLAFARKPGMVVKYDLDGEWTKDISVDEGEFLFAFFVPISGSLLQEKYTDSNNDKQFSTVEDYLRGTENADHAEWDDITINGGPETIVRRIKNRIVKHINEVLREDEGEQASATSKLGRKYGSLLLPGRSSGNAPRPKTTSPKTPTGTKNRRATLNVLSTTPSTQTEAFTVYQMDTEVYLAANTVASMQVFVRAGSKKFTASDWEEETDLIPPFDFGNPQTEAKVADKVEIDTLAENLDQGQFFVKNGSDENLTFRLKFELIVERGQHLAPIVELSTTKDKGGE
ncbi:hypothetical protein [Weissella confusa]|uniref:hypothetical protein n=1 Tax=Weissella confusa TaxID=1583 RepID=UPI00223A7C3C|nr:hypothetical protein [Weissella confusa]MCT0006161.1 hypothetical protein [Weissella confusa]MCT0019105.1 hypothetical protein [Weissella confusa]MCT0039918.1 hypothetical protein [Weissella confusa]